MLRKILLVLAVLVAAFLLLVTLQPSRFHVARSAVIPAPPSVVFAQVGDLHLWQAWSPWAKLDPAATITFDGPASGVGASYSWSGNAEVGAGRMTITEYRPGESVRFRLEFKRPFEGTNESEFTFRENATGTVVEWTMTGENTFVAKAVGLFMNCDKMVGDQFEKGLANLQAVSVAAAKN